MAQAGGGRNLDRLYGRSRELRESSAYAPFFTSWSSPSHFEYVPDTEDRLRRAGFTGESAGVWTAFEARAFSARASIGPAPGFSVAPTADQGYG